MNTSKQINAMVGVLFLSLLVFGAYIAYEPGRAASARDNQADVAARRGAELYVANCRACHGMVGEGSTGAPPLDLDAFLILGEDNQYGAPATPEGEAREVHDFLFYTIKCGRTGTIMPVWGEEHGGPLSNQQINQLVTMITLERWDLVDEIGRAHDEEEGVTAEDVIEDDFTGFALTQGNCGQFMGTAALPFRTRDPFAQPGAPTTPTPDPDAPPPDDPRDAMVQGLAVTDFVRASCGACHGQNREGGIGPSLVPSRLTEPDDFYFDTIANGRPGTAMPAWRGQGLTDPEIEAIVRYITNVEP